MYDAQERSTSPSDLSDSTNTAAVLVNRRAARSSSATAMNVSMTASRAAANGRLSLADVM